MAKLKGLTAKVEPQGANESVIRDVFVRRGILPNPKRRGKRAGQPFDEIRQGVRQKRNGHGK